MLQSTVRNRTDFYELKLVARREKCVERFELCRKVAKTCDIHCVLLNLFHLINVFIKKIVVRHFPIHPRNTQLILSERLCSKKENNEEWDVEQTSANHCWWTCSFLLVVVVWSVQGWMSHAGQGGATTTEKAAFPSNCSLLQRIDKLSYPFSQLHPQNATHYCQITLTTQQFAISRRWFFNRWSKEDGDQVMPWIRL